MRNLVESVAEIKALSIAMDERFLNRYLTGRQQLACIQSCVFGQATNAAELIEEDCVMRRIVQVTATPPVAINLLFGLYTQKFEPTVFALCDDATVWVMQIKTSPGSTYFYEWKQLPDIPQD